MATEVDKNQLPKTTRNNNLTRKEFGRVVSTTLACIAVGGTLGGSIVTPEQSEALTEQKTHVLDIFGLHKFRNKVIQQTFPPNFSETQALREMGINDPTSVESLKVGFPRTEEQLKLVMLLLLEARYKNHGEEVVRVIQETAKYLDPDRHQIQPNTSSITSAFKLENLTVDELGNPSMHISLSQNAITAAVFMGLSDMHNLSFELGSFSFTYNLYGLRKKYPEMARMLPSTTTINGNTTYKDYQGNQITEIEYEQQMSKANETVKVTLEPQDRSVSFVDGYANEDTSNNLFELVKLANRFPNKIFVATGGNPSKIRGKTVFPNIIDARKKLTENGLWPNNLIIVGFEGVDSGFKAPASFGSDIYVAYEDLKQLGFPQASSFATPIVFEIVRAFRSLAIAKQVGIKEILDEISLQKNLTLGISTYEYRVVDLPKVSSILAQIENK